MEADILFYILTAKIAIFLDLPPFPKIIEQLWDSSGRARDGRAQHGQRGGWSDREAAPKGIARPHKKSSPKAAFFVGARPNTLP
jgi:hypothetical protein